MRKIPENQLCGLPVPARDHSSGDMALPPVHTLSLRDVEDLLAERGVAVSYETVRRWVNHFGPMIAANLRKRRPKPHTTWHLDEVYLKIDGRMGLPPAGRRRRGRGPRCAGPVQAKQARRAEADAQASQEIRHCPRADGHR